MLVTTVVSSETSINRYWVASEGTRSSDSMGGIRLGAVGAGVLGTATLRGDWFILGWWSSRGMMFAGGLNGVVSGVVVGTLRGAGARGSTLRGGAGDSSVAVLVVKMSTICRSAWDWESVQGANGDFGLGLLRAWTMS